MKKQPCVYLESLGCSKNTVDSEIMLTILEERGCEITRTPDEASHIIVNTCAFIDEAKEEAIGRILDLSKHKRRGARLIVAGCLSQLHYKEILLEIPEVDAVVGIGDIEAALDTALGHGNERDHPQSRVIDRSYREYRQRRVFLTPPGYAYLKIADGCSRRCSFCLIPKIRGRFRSRHPDAVLKEAQSLERNGAREIVIVSQDTLSYGKDLSPSGGLSKMNGAVPDENSSKGMSLKVLLKMLLKATDGAYFRLLYLRPDCEFIKILPLFEDRRLIRYFDVPMQHVSEPVLRSMKRGGDAESYLRMVEEVRSCYPDAVLRTTFIVGYPGETDGDFELLLEFVKKARFDHAGVFCYSPQDGTKARALQGTVPAKIAEQRKRRLLQVQRHISHMQLQKNLGKVFPVLIEGRFENKDIYAGRSYHFAPEVDGMFFIEAPLDLEPGSIVEAVVTRAEDYDLYGRLL